MATKKIRATWYAGGKIWVLTTDFIHYTHKADALNLAKVVRDRLLRQIRKTRIIETRFWNCEGGMSEDEMNAIYDAQAEMSDAHYY